MFRPLRVLLMIPLVSLLWGASVLAWWLEENSVENINPGSTSNLEVATTFSETLKNEALKGTCRKAEWNAALLPFDPTLDGGVGVRSPAMQRNIQGVSNSRDHVRHEEGCPSDRDEMPASYIQHILSNVISVPVIGTKKEFAEFLLKGTLQLIVFYSSDSFPTRRKSRRDTFADFLQNFDNASQDLEKYGIFLALVNCSEPSMPSHCLGEKSDSFAFGFQNQVEKIAFPLETLFSADSIVASALHLSLLYTVPIIQSLTERQNLETRCRHRCDIVLSFQQSLGTKEHRLFLESSLAFKRPNFVFALTTYTAGVHGLPPSLLDKKDAFDSEPVTYVIHCSGDGKEHEMYEEEKDDLKRDDSRSDPCSTVSHFHGNFNAHEFHTFLRIFKLPLWHEIIPNENEEKYQTWLTCTEHPGRCKDDVTPPGPLITPFDDVDIPWAIFVYDQESERRVRNLVSPLAKILRGFVVLLIIERSRLNSDLRIYFGVNSDPFEMPALIFFDPSEKKEGAPYVSDFSDTYQWIVNQFSTYRQNRRKVEEQREEYSDTYLEPKELRQDDEMVNEMVAEELLTSVVPLNVEKGLGQILSKEGPTVIVFYISWDPVCNMLLQHLHLAAELLREAESRSSLHRLNCFNWPNLCANLQATSSYPILRIFSKGQLKMTYDGPIEKRPIAKSILLVECQEEPLPLRSQEDLEIFLSRGMPCPASEMAESFIAGIFPSKEQAETYLSVCGVLRGYKMMAVFLSEESSKIKCKSIRRARDAEEVKSPKGCIVISKPTDTFQPVVLVLWDETGLSPKSLEIEIRHSSEPVFAPLDPERLDLASLVLLSGGEDPHKRQLSFILILKNSNNEGRDSPHSNTPNIKGLDKGPSLKEDLCFQTIGRIAARSSRSGVVFSYLEGSDELREELLNVYGLKGDMNNIVALDRTKGQVTVFDSSHGTDEDKLIEWTEGVIKGTIASSVVLPQNTWPPTMAGFDFLKYMEEDLLREAEEQLVADMDLDFGHENVRRDRGTKVSAFS